MILVVKENTWLKLTLVIPTGVSIMLAELTIETPPLAADKTIKALSE